MTNPIRAALDKAAEAARIEACKPGRCGEGTGCEVEPCHCSREAATAAVAAFLYAFNSSKWPRAIWLANAVLDAAKEDRE
jgi:hypothetical protein